MKDWKGPRAKRVHLDRKSGTFTVLWEDGREEVRVGDVPDADQFALLEHDLPYRGLDADGNEWWERPKWRPEDTTRRYGAQRKR